MHHVYAFITGKPSHLGTFRAVDEAVDQALRAALLHGFAVLSDDTGSACFIVDDATGEVFTTGTSPEVLVSVQSVLADCSGVASR